MEKEKLFELFKNDCKKLNVECKGFKIDILISLEKAALKKAKTKALKKQVKKLIKLYADGLDFIVIK